MVKQCFISEEKYKALNKFIKEQQLYSKLSNCPFNDPFEKYIKDSIYIVPPNTLLAYQYINGVHIQVAYQTVWIINKYEKGYYFGKVYTALNGIPGSELNVVGSVTPLGDVYMTFFSLSGDSIITGIGKFIITECSGFFLMQMNNAQDNFSGLAHWSYMTSVAPGDSFYEKLPSVGKSIPEFIKEFK